MPKPPSNIKIFKEGLWTDNPVLRQILGICSTLAVTNLVVNTLVMNAGLVFTLSMSSLTDVKRSSRCCCLATGCVSIPKIECSTKRQNASWQPAHGSTHRTMRMQSPKSFRRYWHEPIAMRSRYQRNNSFDHFLWD